MTEEEVREEQRRKAANPSWLAIFVRKHFNVGSISIEESQERMAESILHSLKTDADGWKFKIDDMNFHSYPQGLQYHTISNKKITFRIIRTGNTIELNISHPIHMTLEHSYAERIFEFLAKLAQISKGDKHEFLVDHMEKNPYHLMELKKESINYYDFIFWCYHETQDSYYIDTEYKTSFSKYDRSEHDAYRVWFKNKEDGTTAKMLWG